MKPTELLRRWEYRRKGTASWLASLEDDGDDVRVMRACARTLARPKHRANVIAALLTDGFFEAAAALINEPCGDEVNTQTLERLSADLDAGVQASIDDAEAALSELERRAQRLQLRVARDDIVEAAKTNRPRALLLLKERGQKLDEAEDARKAELHGRLSVLTARQEDDAGVREWQARVAKTIDRGALDAAGAALAAGPSLDRDFDHGVPSPPIWPYAAEQVETIVRWMHDEGAIPPGFEKYQPAADDAAARTLLSVLRSWPHPEPAELLAALVDACGFRTLSIEAQGEGCVAFAAGLAAPDVPAFAASSWRGGVPLWFSPSNASFASDARFIVQVTDGKQVTPATTLDLSLHDVFAVLADREQRRIRLLAQLARQIPLRLAFGSERTDSSACSVRPQLVEDVLSRSSPVLVVGAPGSGKTALLASIAEARRADVIHYDGRGLPMGDVLLIDQASPLLDEELQQLAFGAFFAASKKGAYVVIAIRPEQLAVVEAQTPDTFDVVELVPRSIDLLREQARRMLAWVGIRATAEQAYDRLGFLAGGNPLVLTLLCGSIAEVLAEDEARREFSAEDVDRAFQQSAFREGVRELLWAPLRAVRHSYDVLGALATWADPGKAINVQDLLWSLTSEGSAAERSAAWLGQILSVLRGYHFVSYEGDMVRFAQSGVGRLAREWASESTLVPERNDVKPR